MRAGGYFDQLSEPISNLGLGERLQKAEIEECLGRSMVCPQTVLVVAVVDGDLDGDGCVYQSNDGRRDADVVCVSTIGGAGKAEKLSVQ